MMHYVDYVYDIIKAQSYKSAALTEGYIVEKVGTYGFDTLLNSGLLEMQRSDTFSVVYILKEKKVN